MKTDMPLTVTVYHLFCVLMMCVFLVLSMFSIYLIVSAARMDFLPGMIIGSLFALLGLLLTIAYFTGMFLAAKPFAWIYGTVLIGFAITFLITMPLAGPLLLFWLKDHVKEYFQMSLSAKPPAPPQVTHDAAAS